MTQTIQRTPAYIVLITDVPLTLRRLHWTDEDIVAFMATLPARAIAMTNHDLTDAVRAWQGAAS